MTQADYGLVKNENFSRRSEPNQSMIRKMSKVKFSKEVTEYFRTNTDKKLNRGNEFICDLCRKEFVDPRVLPCLHCFCVQCLHKLHLEQNPRNTTSKRSCNDRFQGVSAGYFSKDDFSKNECLKSNPILEGDSSVDGGNKFFQSSCWSSKTMDPILKCPTCKFEISIHLQEIYELPPHYLLQHRMLIKSLNKGEICLLCDLCPSEIPATSRCTRCLLNLCNHCSKNHKREKLFPDHELMKLKKKNQEGVGITRIRRQAMCPAHPENELKLYCSSCNQVTCTECRVEFHSNHNCESSSVAAQMYMCKIKESLKRICSLNKDTSVMMIHLNAMSQEIETKYSQVHKEINIYIDCYVGALEEHRKNLLSKATKIKDTQIQSIKKRQREVETRVKDIGHSIRFGEELISEGSDFEVLSFAVYVIRRLEWFLKSGSSAIGSAITNCVGTLQFLPDEHAGTIKNHPMFGVVVTQTVSPSHCYITPEGVNSLRNCIENERVELTLVTADGNDQVLTHGAEGIEVDLKSKNGSQKQIPIYIVDHQNGVYNISFTPDVPGKMSLFVSIRGISIKGSPFSVHVRSHKIHKGVFHCCTFCSSGGNKNAVCGCGGRMPGGYHGCGHGYTGHPGQRHWSCCGNTLPKSECLRSIRKDGFYQLSL